MYWVRNSESRSQHTNHIYLPSEEQIPNAANETGHRMADWSESAKADFKADLEKVIKLPPDMLRPVVYKIAKTHPACNPIELAALEAEQSSIADPQALTDAISVFTYIWEV